MSSPKVLILNQPFDSVSGGGITLTNLFESWEKENLAVACSGYLLTNKTNPKRCTNYYQLGSKERTWTFPFNLLSRKYYSGPIQLNANEESVSENVVVNKSPLREKLIFNYILPISDYLGISHFKASVNLSPEFCAWVKEFNPKVVYAQATEREELLFCLKFQEYFDIPMVFHMMDDWPKMVGAKGFRSKYWERKVNAEFKQLLDSTRVGMSISDYMGEVYKERYGKDFTTFHNSINIDFWKKAQRENYVLSEQPRLLYAGRVGLGIDDSLKNIAAAIDTVNKDLNVQVTFALQVKEKPEWAADYNCVKHNSFVSYDDLPRVFAEADFLVLPYDFSEESISFIQYSMPTKAPEYMISGTPILIFSPEDTALVRYAKKRNWAKVVTKNNVNVLAEGIKELLLNEELRRKIAQNAIYYAEKKHNSKTVSADFEKLINSAISS